VKPMPWLAKIPLLEQQKEIFKYLGYVEKKR
jgi:hypothetical protein